MADVVQAEPGRFTMKHEQTGRQLPVVSFLINESDGSIQAITVASGEDVSQGYRLVDNGSIRTKRRK